MEAIRVLTWLKRVMPLYDYQTPDNVIWSVVGCLTGLFVCVCVWFV